MSAEDRRALVLAAAVAEFAKGGLAGTSTETIARRAGISQPYLFRLFPTKKDLFLAVVADCFARTVAVAREAAGERTGEDALMAIADAYTDLLLVDRTYLLVQLHAYAGCDDDDVRAVTRHGYRDLWNAIATISGAEPERVRDFFAHGMLLNVAAAMDLPAVDEEWAKLVCLDPTKGAHTGAAAAAATVDQDPSTTG
jgi:AcrR family transcriptional regulator